MESFKQRMARLRKRAGFKSQQEAAEAIGCERGTVGMWEAPSSAVESVGAYLLPTARAYKVRPEYLMSGKGDDGYPWVLEKNSPHNFTDSSPTSQVQRIDPAMLSQAMRLIEMIDEFRDSPAPTETFPARLSIAYMVVAEEIATQGEGNVVHMDTARRLAARLRQENADKDDDGNKRGQATRAGV